jgi:hypothetical protein
VGAPQDFRGGFSTAALSVISPRSQSIRCHNSGTREKHTLAKLSITGVLAMQPLDAFERMHISQGEEDFAGRTRQAHGWRIGSPAGILLDGFKIDVDD